MDGHLLLAAHAWWQARQRGGCDAEDSHALPAVRWQPVSFQVPAVSHADCLEGSEAAWQGRQQAEVSCQAAQVCSADERQPVVLLQHTMQHVERSKGWHAVGDSLQVRARRQKIVHCHSAAARQALLPPQRLHPEAAQVNDLQAGHARR